MLNSMTGYGEAEGLLNGVSYAVEIKTVNNRYVKTNIKLPDVLAFFEDDIDKLVRNNLARGTVNYVLRLKDISANALFEIDEPALQMVLGKLNAVGSSAGIHSTIDIGSLLTLPGIVKPAMPDKDAAQQIKALVLNLTQQALDRLKQMRAAEGQFLEADLKTNCDATRQDIEFIRGRIAIVVKDYARRLRKRVDELLSEAKLKLDEETLAREVAILADRSDISEELARLNSHLQQVEQVCRTDGQAGRRLDFISQEMFREANTIASKASDTEIARCVVDIKCRIDRIKEQVQNVE